MLANAGSYRDSYDDYPRSQVVAPKAVSPGDRSPDLAIGFPTGASPEKAQRQSSLRFVMFPVGEIDLAIPIATVAKVVNLGAVKGRDQSPWGVTALGNQPYTVLDLHHYLFQTPLAPSPQGGYLVLIYLATGELVGIPTVCTPTLVEVCWDQVRFLPAAYRKADRLAVASHMARWTDPETQADHFLFVLDISALSAL